MNLHEYQAKQIFADHNLPVSKNFLVTNSKEVKKAFNLVGGDKWVMKTQVHAGGRGKVGGVKLIDNIEDGIKFTNQWIGKRLISKQTDEKGQPVSVVMVEPCIEIEKELYLSAVVDRSAKAISIIASEEGGVNIEEVAETNPEKIFYEKIDLIIGPQPYQARRLSEALHLDAQQSNEFWNLFKNLVKMFVDCDMSLVEINPLIITSEGHLHCLDAKVNLDSNALFRQSNLANMRDLSQEDPQECEASNHDLSYVSLDGNIGCMVNGAGLAMGTMDTIKFYGGEPANFLDVGGAATKERVAKAFKIILNDPKVKVILVNIFGGIVRCDLIAEGIIAAVKETELVIPIVVRLEGNNSKLGSDMLQKSSLAIESDNDLENAAKKAILLAE